MTAPVQISTRAALLAGAAVLGLSACGGASPKAQDDSSGANDPIEVVSQPD